jgi:ferredoxin-nitrite reductase
MNKFEEIKAEKNGLDAYPDLERIAHEGYESMTDEDKVRMKWFGVFFRRHIPGFFMLRIRIPNGIATSEQMRTIAEVAKDFARGEIDITTRQQVQIRWYRVESAIEMLARLRAVGIDTRQTGMDNIRNVMGCSLAGLTAHELFDASPIAREFSDRFVGNPEFSNLPRKFNVTITGCTTNCLPLESQDVAMGPAIKQIGTERVAGFNVLVGGKSGSGGFIPAQPLDVFVRPEEASEVAAQITLIFRDHGSRETRAKARLFFLLEERGVEWLRSELESRMSHALERAGHDARTNHTADHLGIVPHHQLGLYSVGLLVPSGQLTSEQLSKAADLAGQYGSGEIRLTASQNLTIPSIPDRKLPAFLTEPLLTELRADPTPAVRGTVSCTGLGTCDLALADTKQISLRIARSLDEAVRIEKPLTLHWSGCPAACAHHQLATIGVQGDKARINGEIVEVYQVFVGGQAGQDSRAGVKVLEDVPADHIEEVIVSLARAREAGEDLVRAACNLQPAAVPTEVPSLESA